MGRIASDAGSYYPEQTPANNAQKTRILYKLAEVRGLAGDISGVHEARAEYFILVGALDRARRQLGLAAKLVEADFKRHSVVKQRLRDIVNARAFRVLSRQVLKSIIRCKDVSALESL